MKLVAVALIAGVTSIGGYKLLDVNDTHNPLTIQEENPSFIPTTYSTTTPANFGIDFTEAAEKTVGAVVHVKNKSISSQPTNMFDYMNGR